MAKGIRSAVNHKFIELSSRRLAGEYGDINSGTLSVGNVAFRALVIAFAVDVFAINHKSAATAYNHAFKEAAREHPELVVGLGRAGDKKGGRKPGQKTVNSNVSTESAPTEQPAVVDTTVVEEIATPTEVQTWSVVRAKDGELQSSGLLREEAQALVDKAARGKKAKLIIV